MKNFLRSIGLIQEYSLTLNCSKAYFLRMLQENIDPPGFQFFERFQSGRPFKGSVGNNEFEIRQRAQGMHQTFNMVVSFTGTVIERNDKAVLNVEASGFSGFIRFIAGFILFIYVVGIGSTMTVQPLEEVYITLLLLPVHAAFMFGILYIALRRAVNNSKREIEKEFFFLTKDFHQESVRQI